MKTAKISKKYLLSVVLGLGLFACGNNSVYEESKQIKNAEWSVDSLAVFSVPVVDTIDFFDVYVSVRNNNDYSESNLYLFIKTTSPQGSYVVDTINLQLADEYGNWLGKRVSRLWDNKFLFRRNVRFANSGNYKFAIQQGMRHNVLEGISDVSVTIEKTKIK